MSLDMFRACARGYADRMFDLQLLSVQQGYWAGYYNNSKKPKSAKTIIETLIRRRSKPKEHASEVDVDAFLKMEEQFNRRLNM